MHFLIQNYHIEILLIRQLFQNSCQVENQGTQCLCIVSISSWHYIFKELIQCSTEQILEFPGFFVLQFPKWWTYSPADDIIFDTQTQRDLKYLWLKQIPSCNQFKNSVSSLDKKCFSSWILVLMTHANGVLLLNHSLELKINKNKLNLLQLYYTCGFLFVLEFLIKHLYQQFCSALVF